jgi:hypothetical protein
MIDSLPADRVVKGESRMKEVKLINGKFSWFLCVDGRRIAFQGAENADYFAEHYRGLGYTVSVEQEE